MALLGGKNSPSTETKQTAINQQVATTSGIAVGGANNSANISVETADPEVAEAAIRGNAYVSDSALNFAGRAAEVAAMTNIAVTSALERTAGTAILSNSDLAKKFAEGVSETAAQNVNLLQSVGQQQTDIALQSQRLAGDALSKSFAISAGTAPQTDASLIQGVSKYFAYAAAAIAAIFLVMFFRRKGA